MTRRFDVMVIGGGVAGLVAALEARQEGVEVALLDSRRAGGRARTSLSGEFRFNQGPHALYRAGAFAASLRRFGIDLAGGSPALERAGVWSSGRVLPLPTSPLAALRSRLLSGRAKLASRRVMAALDREPAGPLAGVSLRELLEARRAPGDLAAFVEMFARLSTYVNAPELISAEAVVTQYRLARHGVIYVDHGWQRLVDGLAGAFVTAGGVLLEHHPVTTLGCEGREWAAVSGQDQVVAVQVA